MKKSALIEAFKKYQSKIEEASAIYQSALFNDNCDFSAALATFEFARKNAMLAYEKDAREIKKAAALAALLSASDAVMDTSQAVSTASVAQQAIDTVMTVSQKKD